MSTVGEEKYVDLKQICDQVDPDLFETLSWILLLNLDLIPADDVKINPNLLFSHLLMQQKYAEALEVAIKISNAGTPLSKRYIELLEKDPKLQKTNEIAETFFALVKRRIEIMEKLGIYHG